MSSQLFRVACVSTVIAPAVAFATSPAEEAERRSGTRR